MLISDGVCNDFNNNRHCSFDGGDCCGPCVNKESCSECECKTGKTNKISNALVGNGFCNDDMNNLNCTFDGGDCCGACVNIKYCSVCECLGENLGVINGFLDDGFCQDETNHEDCMFDGQDCCGYDWNNDGYYNDIREIAPGDTTFCTECTCKGMKNYKLNIVLKSHSKLIFRLLFYFQSTFWFNIFTWVSLWLSKCIKL